MFLLREERKREFPHTYTWPAYAFALFLLDFVSVRFNERVQEALKLVTFVSELSLWARRKHKKIPYGQFLKRSSTSGGGSAGGNRSTGEESGSGVPGNTNETTATTNAAGTASTSLKSSNPSPTDKINYEEILEPWTEPSGPGHDVSDGIRAKKIGIQTRLSTKPGDFIVCLHALSHLCSFFF